MQNDVPASGSLVTVTVPSCAVGGGHPHSRVGDRQGRAASCLCQRHVDAAGLRGELDRVRDDVVERLAQTHGVAFDQDRVGPAVR